MPGSPPSKVTDPATKPPPSTRSNSPDPVATRIGECCDSAASVEGGADSRPGPRLRRSAPAAAAAATSVFHSPQVPHCPCHFGETLPQLPQTNTSRPFAMPILSCRFCELSIAVPDARSPILLPSSTGVMSIQ